MHEAFGVMTPALGRMTSMLDGRFRLARFSLTLYLIPAIHFHSFHPRTSITTSTVAKEQGVCTSMTSRGNTVTSPRKRPEMGERLFSIRSWEGTTHVIL